LYSNCQIILLSILTSCRFVG